MNKSIRIIHWLPRIICISAILFISLFALDSFTSGLTIGQQIYNFIIHLLPSFCLIFFLIIAWKNEYIGGVIFTIIGVFFSPLVFIHNYKMNNSIWISIGIITFITIPFVITGILFFISYYKKKSK